MKTRMNITEFKMVAFTAILCIVSLTLSAQCPVPTGNSQSGCSGTYTISATSFSSSVTAHRWYTAASGGSQVAITNEFSPTSGIWVSQLNSTFNSSVTYYVAAVCSGVESTSRAAVTFTVNNPPNVSFTLTNSPTNVCQDGNYKMTAINGTNYEWKLDGNHYSYATEITPTQSGLYTIYGYNGCNQNQNYSVPITMATDVSISSITCSICSSNTRCQSGGDTQFTANTSGASGLSWTVLPAEAGSMNPTSGLMTWSSAFTGTATITVQASGCHGPVSLNKVITVTPPPLSATLSGPSYLCSIGVYSSGAIVFTRTPEAGVTYSLYLNGSPTGLSPNNQGSGYPTWTINEVGTYSLRATSGSCTETIVGGPITVNSASPGTINAAISPNTYVTPVCPGTQFTLTASGGSNFTWTGSPFSEIIPNGSPVTVTPSVTTVYRVTGQESICLTSSYYDVYAYINTTTVSQVGTPSPAAGNVSFCQGGGSTDFSISPASNATGGYVWSIDDPNALEGSIVVNGSGTGATFPWASNYAGSTVVRVTAHGPCNSTTIASLQVSFKPIPLKNNLTGSNSLCLGETTEIVLTMAPESNVTYSLLQDGAPTGFSFSQIPYINYMRWTVSQTGTYSVVANFAGCPAVDMNNTLTISEEPKQYLSGSITTDPFEYPPVYCVDDIDFKATSSHLGSFTWYRNGEPILTSSNGVNSAIYDPVTFNSNYDELKVRFTAQTGQCLFSDEFEATLSNSFFKIGLDVVPNSTEITVSGDSFRCEGQGETNFYAFATNGKAFSWFIDPPAAGTIVALGSKNATAKVTWNAAFSGTAAIRATAQGCNNTFDEEWHTYLVNPIPNVPAISSLNYCDFEPVVLKGAGGNDVTNHNWFDQSSKPLGSGFQLPLNVKKTGTYSYQYEPISEFGCINSNKATLTVTVGNGGDCDNKLNWIESIGYNYTQDGSNLVQSEISHSKAYFDLTGKGLQSQTKNFSSGQIFTAHTVNDAFDRPALATLSVPLDQINFAYKHWIALDQAGGLYDYTNLGEPLAAEPGTVGWYYSELNTASEAPKTVYPFSQTDYYTDGTGEVRRSSAPGEVLRLGQGKETWSGTFPVYKELDDYLQRRSDIGLLDLQTDNTLAGEGVQTVARDQNGRFVISIADKSGKTVMSARPGKQAATEHVLEVPNNIVANNSDEKKLTYFYLLDSTTVTVTPVGAAEYVMHNLITDATGQHFQDPENDNKWPPGFYRMVVNAGQVTLAYTSYFLDVSYQFYDDAGRLKASISPNGMKKWLSATSSEQATQFYSTLDKTTYVYNHQGWLLEMTEPDAGTTRYVYRKDGKIRFSQNAEQETNGRYSYTHYDLLGRPVESGEYDGTGIPFVSMSNSNFSSSPMKAELEKLAHQVAWTGQTTDWVKTFYDFEDPQFTTHTGLAPSSFTQEYIRGAVSYTQNANNKTWYSYDELGRVTWLVQKPTGLSAPKKRVFVTKYDYDYLGNVLNTSTQMYFDNDNNGAVEAVNATAFYHHYTYDADKRLVKVETSPDGTNKKIRAKYEYYLHGPLKRIELGETIQGIDFVYNIHGWLTQINHPQNSQDPGADGQAGDHAEFKPDAFGLVLDYFENTVANVFAASLSPKLLNPGLFHGLPENNDPVVASNLESLNALSQLDWRSIAKESVLRNEAALSNMVSPNK